MRRTGRGTDLMAGEFIAVSLLQHAKETLWALRAGGR